MRWWARAGATALVVVGSTTGAFVADALWSSRASLPGELRSGSLQLVVNGDASPPVIDVSATASLDQETVRYVTLEVADAGTEALRYRLAGVTGTAVPDATLLTVGLRLSVFVSTAAPCSGSTLGTQLVANGPIGSASFANRNLAESPTPGSEVLCAVLRIPPVKDNNAVDGSAYRPGTASLTFHFEADAS